MNATPLICLMLFALPSCAKEAGMQQLANADAERGKAAIVRYGCAACHAIPGIAHQGSNVGPPLHRIARRAYLGGVAPNTLPYMVRWLRNPTELAPRTAMPRLGISEAEAKDIAAYLYTLD